MHCSNVLRLCTLDCVLLVTADWGESDRLSGVRCSGVHAIMLLNKLKITTVTKNKFQLIFNGL